jgi:hypothetical protein
MNSLVHILTSWSLLSDKVMGRPLRCLFPQRNKIIVQPVAEKIKSC